MHWSFRLFLAWLLLAGASALRAQSTVELVRGRVTDLAEHPLTGAMVTVSGLRTGAVRSTRTDSTGHFVTIFHDPEGEYTILVRNPGFTPTLRKGTRAGLSNVIVVDASLGTSPFPLPPLVARSPITGPQRRERSAVGGISQDAAFQGGYLTDPSSLAALVALLPGVLALGDSTYSVMGATPDQNSTLLDGMNFDGGNLPPDASCSVQMATTTSDPSRGQFTGGQTSVTSCRGLDLHESTIRASQTEPWLGWSDSRSLQPPGRVTLASGFVSGPIRTGVAHFRFSALVRESRTPSQSLLSLKAPQLSGLGIIPDTVNAFVAALAARGIPVGAPDGRGGGEFRSASGLLSLDWSPGSISSWAMTASGNLSSAAGIGLGATTLPATTERSTANNGRLLIRGSTYIHGAVDQLTALVSRMESRYSPNLSLPGGTVRVGTQYPSGVEGTTLLQFGGGSFASRATSNELNLRNQLSVTLGRNSHQLSFGQQISFDSRTLLSASDTLGRYTYQSLADLGANRPSAYRRTLGETAQAGSATAGALWIADTWRASRAISFEGGLRADGNRFGRPPSYNSAIDALFGLRTDRLPSSSGISPRLGFAWLVEPLGNHPTVTKSGITIEHMYIDPADDAGGEPRRNDGGGTTLFGNVGAYRGSSSLAQVLGLRGHTGLAGESQSLGCVGDATPIPDWSGSAGAVFSTCRGGSGAERSDGAASTVTVLNPSYRPPLDWKVNLGLNRFLLGGGYIEVFAILLREIGTSSVIDRNLTPVPQFRLPGEGNRPVFVRPSELLPATGMYGPFANRVSNAYGAVSELVSDLHRSALQINIAITTPHLLPIRQFIPALIQYSYNRQSREQRGFDGTTAGDPFAVESVQGAQPHHQLMITTLSPLHLWWFAANVRLNLQSGTAYTPIVAGDINGDGSSFNDRAFVANPKVTADSALAAQMTSLLSSAPASARRCLEEQLGRIAGANSCRGPWQARVDLTLDLTPPPGVGLGQRLRLTTSFLNAGAALMRILGVSGSLSQGVAPPDGTLLYLTGFDPVAQHFTYRVNPAFGKPINAGVGKPSFPPFQLRLGLEYQLAGRELSPYLHQLGIDPRGSAATRDSATHRIIERLAANPIDMILALRDSLLLVDQQITGLERLRARFVTRRDAAGAPVIDFVAKRGRFLVDGDMDRVLTPFFQDVSQARVDARDAALSLLLPDQRTKLAAMLRSGSP